MSFLISLRFDFPHLKNRGNNSSSDFLGCLGGLNKLLHIKTLRKHIASATSMLGLPQKIPRTRWLQQQKFIFSQSWRLEVRDQGVTLVGSGGNLLPGLQMATFLWCPHMACPHMACPHMASPPRVCKERQTELSLPLLITPPILSY